jgi:hypothetical protein
MKVSDEVYRNVRVFILRKLVNHSIWGAKHTSYDNLQKGLPKDFRHIAKEVADRLIKERFLLSHPTSYGLQVSLNPLMAREIKELLNLGS